MSRIYLLVLFISIGCFSQETSIAPSYWDVQAFSGTLLRHNKNVAHLVTAHPQGLLVTYNKRTSGKKYWQEAYNYPDWGISFLYEDLKNETLGENYGLYGHFNFYFLNRNLQLRLAQGIAYNTNPFDLATNFKNIAYGSQLLASTYLLVNYKTDLSFLGEHGKRFSLQTGISFVHHSNGSFKAPNSGTNVVAVNVGVGYDVSSKIIKRQSASESIADFSEKIAYNFVLRGGLNEGDIIGLGQQPFLVIAAFADKRLNYKSTIQLGAEVFLSKFLKEEIQYRALSFPSSGLTGDEDYKRVSVFAGHEFRLGKFAIPTQLGYYIYWPYAYENRVYSRVGVKRYFTPKLFGVATVKTHGANAEAIEFGIGIRM